MLTMMTASAAWLHRVAVVVVELHRAARRRQAAAAALSGLDDWILQDIGATRPDIGRRGAVPPDARTSSTGPYRR